MSGVRRQVLTFHVWDRVHLFFNVETSEVRLQWKARELWSRPQLEALRHWISTVSLYFGEVLTLDTAFDVGWTMTGLEICADFVDLRWRNTDGTSFVGKFKPTIHYDADGEAETASLGKRSSNVSLVLYDKTGQIERVGGRDGIYRERTLATYKATWRAFGWQGENVSRAEFRLASRGLTWHDQDGVVLDLRNPAKITPENIARAWQHCSGKYRLVLDDATRRERCSTDPRWKVVQASVHAEPEQLVQYREVSEAAHAEKVRRAARQFGRALSELASLHGLQFGADTSARAAFAAALAGKELDLAEHSADYSKLIDPAVGAECQAAREVPRTWWGGPGTLPAGTSPRPRTDTPGWWERGPP